MAKQDSDAPSADLVLESGGRQGSAWSVGCVGWPRTATVSSGLPAPPPAAVVGLVIAAEMPPQRLHRWSTQGNDRS